MKLIEILQAFLLLPQTRKHLLEVKGLLVNTNYPKLIEEINDIKSCKYSIKAIVKSYFWASRTIKGCKCLPRSIALYQKLKLSGYEVEHKFGVNKVNKELLAAHAWVEYKQKPLNEAADLTTRFNVLKSCD